MIRFDLLFGGEMGHWAFQREMGGMLFHAFPGNCDVNKELEYLFYDDPAPVAISVHYPRILGKPFLARYKKVYNLHPGYLPWGRGMYPMVWAIRNNEPAGATLHEVTERLDDGPIVDQRQVPVYATDTAADLQERVRVVEKQIFLDLLAKLAQDIIPDGRASTTVGSYHDRAAFEEARLHGLLPEHTSDFLRHMRAFTNRDYPGMVVSLEDPVDPRGRPRRFEVALKPLD